MKTPTAPRKSHNSARIIELYDEEEDEDKLIIHEARNRFKQIKHVIHDDLSRNFIQSFDNLKYYKREYNSLMKEGEKLHEDLHNVPRDKRNTEEWHIALALAKDLEERAIQLKGSYDEAMQELQQCVVEAKILYPEFFGYLNIIFIKNYIVILFISALLNLLFKCISVTSD
jgi:hypothetical protein